MNCDSSKFSSFCTTAVTSGNISIVEKTNLFLPCTKLWWFNKYFIRIYTTNTYRKIYHYILKWILLKVPSTRIRIQGKLNLWWWLLSYGSILIFVLFFRHSRRSAINFCNVGNKIKFEKMARKQVSVVLLQHYNPYMITSWTYSSMKKPEYIITTSFNVEFKFSSIQTTKCWNISFSKIFHFINPFSVSQ